MPRSRTRLLAAIVTILTLVAITIVITVDGGDSERKPSATITIRVDGLDAGKVPDRTVEVPRTVVRAAAPRLHDALVNETPAGVPGPVLQDARDAAAKIADTVPPLDTAGATRGFTGCRTSFVANQSTRRGVRPNVQTLHYTVSPNRPGWSDVNAITALFDRPSFQASSHFIIDSEGNCAYIVPIEAKAWTQAAGNPFSVSYEIIATGREARYLEPAGMAKLKAVVAEVSRRTGIPLRRGRINGCVPVTTGIVEHRDWGNCGGGHVDVTPFQVDDIVRQLAGTRVTRTDRVTCRKIQWWRKAGRPAGKARANAVRRRRALDKRGVACTAKGPVRA